jgi:hypothetical protein
MSSRFSLQEAREREPTKGADAVGSILATNRAWLGPFLIFLDGLTFRSTPSMTSGAIFFQGAAKRDAAADQLVEALDDVYRDIRDGFQAAHAYGEMLERYVWHVLPERFPDRIGACELYVDGNLQAAWRLDAATGAETPAVGIEAKTSEQALIGRRNQRRKRTAKAQWVASLIDVTGEAVAGVFVTWAAEHRFRAKLRALIGESAAKGTLVVAREQLSQLPNRVAGLQQRLRPHPTTD